MIRLIVGLGNPGKDYEWTRHNVGFILTDLLARKNGFLFKEKFRSRLASGIIEEKKTMIQQPQTYMNDSGKAVRKVSDYYHIEPQNILIISDDVEIPLGKIRYRQEGSSGGHNGLKDIELHLGTKQYPRLKIGVGREARQKLKDYVLERFSEAELKMLEKVNEEALEILDEWIKGKLGDQTWNVN